MTSCSILSVFNRYRQPGGEEHSVQRIRRHLSERHRVTCLDFDSKEWTGPGAPGRLSQAGRLFYNPEGRRRLQAAVESAVPDVALYHNIYPVGSPALYLGALRHRLPVIQYLHNYRPFSVGGSLYIRGKVSNEPLYGNYWSEVTSGAWMSSPARSAMMALLLKGMHLSGWLKGIKMWVAISDFMRQQLVQAGAVPAHRIVTLRHAWESLPTAPACEDAGYYLFLGRLIAEKGLPELLAAWDGLHTRLGQATPRLHIAGEGPLRDLAEHHARRNPFICILGNVGGAPKADQLARCRAVVIPSVWWEPLGLVTYEAYDYAKPVLAARSGGLAETVLDGSTGFLHEPGAVDQLQSQVLQMETMTATQRAALGNSGRHWLRQETDPTLWQRRFDEILQKTLHGLDE